MKIFVSIASYRDSELLKTLNSAVENARYPNDLNFCVLTQEYPNRQPDLDFLPNINHLQMSFKDAKGAGYARHLLMNEYNGEEYFLQLDSHMRCAPNWDARLITMLEQTKEIADTDKVILSQFPAPYKVLTNGKDEYIQGDPYYWSQPSWTSVVRTYMDTWAGNREPIEDMSQPHFSHAILAGFVFAQGSIVNEVPYDPRISFMGEELCFSIRAYTRGWKIYAPHEMLFWHYYTRKNHPKVWTQRDDANRKVKWKNIEIESMKVQKSVLTNQEQGVYGIGDQDLYEEYQKMIGIDFKEFYKNREY